MKRMLKLIVTKTFRLPIFFHPRGEELLAYLDGELGARRRRALSRHFAACRSCRNEKAQLADSSVRLRAAMLGATHEPQPAKIGREQLRAVIGAYNRIHVNPRSVVPVETSFAQTALGHALIAELKIYLGARTAATIIGKLSGERPRKYEVAIAIEPPLNSFLGKTAAAAVAKKILGLFEFEDRPAADAALLSCRQ